MADAQDEGLLDDDDDDDIVEAAEEAVGETTAESYDYDIVVIGAGPGGYETAIKAAQVGKNMYCGGNIFWRNLLKCRLYPDKSNDPYSRSCFRDQRVTGLCSDRYRCVGSDR